MNCQNQFGSNHSGKLFEPRALATNNEVIEYAQGITNILFLGINDIDIEGTFQYATGGNLVFTNWRSGAPDNYGNVGQDCGMVRFPTGWEWEDENCDLEKHASICEMTLDGNFIH